MRRVNRLAPVLIAAVSLSSCASPIEPGPIVPDNMNCAVFADYRSSPYVLPFAVGSQAAVSRTFGHYLPANGGVGLYAVDFPMPVGTPVHASRGGTVVAVEERFSDEDRATYHENWVMIRHADDSVARYIHLTPHGALVEVGDRIAQGQLVGLSGNSGPSNGPHLHFDVQTCGPNLPPGYNAPPCGMTVPVSFRNTAAHSCGLEPSKAYMALPFTPDSR
jgi:murein DD-endopeptidase MepM/ murein hydrolase activator NlpD